MPGLYIHIPFCRKACHYCNFHFSVNHQKLPAMIEAMVQEIRLSSFPFRLEEQVQLETVYFGGGTPSLLDSAQLQQLIHAIQTRYAIDPHAEITLEANPDDISPEKLQTWKSLGINRLSVGIQSFQSDELAWMNRAHQVEQAIQCLSWIQEAGFDNYSVDLIFGSPLLTDEQLDQNLTRVIEARVPHLSCYALTVENGTTLGHQVYKGLAADVDADKQARQFLLVYDRLTQAGYEGYEISNYALPGYRSRHNSAYWKGIPYGGIGPGAHSYRPGMRQWNVANNSLYIQGIQNNLPAVEHEKLSASQLVNEYIMTALRTVEGIQVSKLNSLTDSSTRTSILQRCRPFQQQGWLEISEEQIKITRTGRLHADGIAADLFMD